MKKILLLLLLVAFFTSAFAIDGQIPVELNGTLNRPGPSRTRSLTPAVTATLEQDYLQLNYNRDLSVVTTTVYNELGEVVYENETVTGYGVVEIIDTIDFEEGNYTIVLTNNYGLYLEGNFVL